jgi:hypothetical protein
MRYLSLYRRRSNLVDVNLQSGPYAPMALGLAAGKVASSYSFYVGANFDTASPTLFQVVPASGGYASPTTSLPGYNIAFDGEQFSQSRTPYLTRFKFAPSDYITGGLVNTAFTTAGVTDLTPFWLTVIQTNLDGTTNSRTAPHLILPYSSQPNRPILLSGTAPEGAALANSLEIQLPQQVNNIYIQNNGSNVLAVAFEPTGPEFLLNPFSEEGTNLPLVYPVSSQIFVRGSGGSTTFNLISSLKNQPTQ